MRILADENVESSIVMALREAGHDVLYMADQNKGCTDEEVFHIASSDQRILLTRDNDFGEMVFRQKKIICGIILMRFSAESVTKKLTTIKHLLNYHSEKLAHHFTVISEEHIRIRPL